MSLLWWRFSAQNVTNLFYHFVSLPSFLYFLFKFNTTYTATHHKVMSLLWWMSSAQSVSNSFYHFVSLQSFLYFLFTLNIAYTASHFLYYLSTGQVSDGAIHTFWIQEHGYSEVRVSHVKSMLQITSGTVSKQCIILEQVGPGNGKKNPVILIIQFGIPNTQHLSYWKIVFETQSGLNTGIA